MSADSEEGRPRARQGSTPPRTFRTTRRLVAAFSLVLVAFLTALAYQVLALRRMEASFASMQERDEQMKLALQLESEVREQYGHQARFVTGGEPSLAGYWSARSRALALGRTLADRVDDPEAAAWVSHIREAGAELDRVFEDRIAPEVRSGDPAALVTHDRAYPLVATIEENVDRIFGRLRASIESSRRDLAAIEARSLHVLAAFLVAFPLLVAAAALYLSRSVARPLARLAQGAAAVGAGRLDARIDLDTSDELGALAKEFDAMTAALKRHQERLVESEKLAGIGRLAAGIAHELNNPLQVILGYLSLARDHRDPRLAARVAAAERQALRCKRIVEGLHELSRPLAAVAPVDLRALCEDVAEGLRAAVQPEGQRLAIHGSGQVLGDGLRLRKVLFNLLQNAEEAAGSGGAVAVRIAASNGVVEVAVCDSGGGLASPDRARLFEPFFTTKPTGTGLGLAVSRAIARAHGGDIEVGPGDLGGAAFTLRLPASPAEGEVRAAAARPAGTAAFPGPARG